MHTSNVFCFLFLVAAAASECEADSSCAGEKDTMVLLQSSATATASSQEEKQEADVPEEEDYEKPEDDDLEEEDEEKAAKHNALIESIADLEDDNDLNVAIDARGLLSQGSSPPKAIAVRMGFNGGGYGMKPLRAQQAKFYTTADCTGPVVTGTTIGTSRVWKTHNTCDEQAFPGCAADQQKPMEDGVDKNGWTGWQTNFCIKGCANNEMFLGYKFDKPVQILSFTDGVEKMPNLDGGGILNIQRALEWAGTDTVWETVASYEGGSFRRRWGTSGSVGPHRRRERGQSPRDRSESGDKMCKLFSTKQATFTLETGKWCGEPKTKPFKIESGGNEECRERCVYDANCHSYELVYGHSVSHHDCKKNKRDGPEDGVCQSTQGLCIIRTTDDCEHQDPPIEPIEKGADYYRYFKNSKAGVHTEKCLTHDGDEDDKTCYTKCAPGFYESGRGEGEKAKCVECQGGTSRRRNYECAPCRPGHVSKDESDECQLLQDMCDPEDCGPCATCMQGIESKLDNCVTKPIAEGGCYNPGTTWCSEAQDALMQCQSKSSGCWYRLLCRDPRICDQWKSVFCGPQNRTNLDGSQGESLWTKPEDLLLLARANLSVDVSLKDDSPSLDESLSGKRGC